MAKPPKGIPGKLTPDTSTPGTSDPGHTRAPQTTPDNLPAQVRPITPGPTGTAVPGSGTATVPRTPDAAAGSAEHAGIVVRELSTARTPPSEFPPDIVVFTAAAFRELTPIADSGLFFIPGTRNLCANVEGLGTVRVKQNSNGHFEIQTDSPHGNLLTLQKIEGKPQWQKHSDALPPAEKGWEVQVPLHLQIVPLARLVIPKAHASALTPPDADGIRHDAPGRKYVDLEDNGTVMVASLNSGGVQAMSAKLLNPNGPKLVRVEGSTRWRELTSTTAGQKRSSAPSDEVAGPSTSKRPRLENAEQVPHLNPHLWLTWGDSNPHPDGSIRMANLHYRTLPGSSEEVALVHLSRWPEGFDAFENSLQNSPWLQPVKAVSDYRAGQPTSSGAQGFPTVKWTVLGPLFNKPIHSSVADAFPILSPTSSVSVARALFERTNPGNALTSPGLQALAATLTRWSSRSANMDGDFPLSPRDLTDPLQLLPITPVARVAGQSAMALPSLDEGQAPRRLRLMSREPTRGKSISEVFSTSLERSGYVVFPLTHFRGSEVVFRREGQLYHLTIQVTRTPFVTYKMPDLRSADFASGIGGDARNALTIAHARGEVIWLTGGVELQDGATGSVFIMRTPAPAQTPAANATVTPTPAPRPPSREAITVANVQHRILPKGAEPDARIVYTVEAEYPASNFKEFEELLILHPQHQPRGATRVPPENHWVIDPRLPFDKALTVNIFKQLPELSTDSIKAAAKRQFVLANGSDNTTGAGLTALRQAFHDWDNPGPFRRPQLCDPLLMLPSLTVATETGNGRRVVLPAKNSEDLLRLDFQPNYFRQEMDFFYSHPGGLHLKNLMAGLLGRNGYFVFEPTPTAGWPTLVLKRNGHDSVFFLSLYRVGGDSIHLPEVPNPATATPLQERVNYYASETVLAADSVGKVVWLKGGVQRFGDQETVFIVRDDMRMI